MSVQFPRLPVLLAALLGVALAGLPAPDLPAQAKKKAASKDGKAGKDAQNAERDAALEKALLKATQKNQTAHLKELERIVDWAAKNGLKAEAQALLAKMETLDGAYPALKRLREAATAAAGEPTEELKKTYLKRIEEANEKNAKRLFDLASRCMKFGLFTRAYDLVSAVIEADPDHKRARDILSYAWDASTKTWITKWEADMKKKFFLTEEGWIKKEHKAKWDKGLRELNGKWITKEEEERIRKRNDYNPFSVETEHFLVLTNLGRKPAFEFATLLEDFHREFFRFFIGFYDQEAGTKLLFNQGKLKKKHVVKVFPTNVEYLTFVKAEKGNQKLYVESAGFYDGGDRCSYFYGTDDRASTLHVLYHEVTHQLFAETKEERGSSKGNNWVVEGIASYMETWEKVNGKWMPGHRVSSDRLQTARHFLASDPDWDLAAFLAVDNQKFHEEGRGLNYALAGALCHFLMHHDSEVYREPFIQFISLYYGGQVVDDSLGRHIKVEGVAPGSATIAALEKQFKEYMSRLGEEPSAKVEAGAEEASNR